MRAVAVIPTLNACELLSAAVASLEAQTVPVEVVVVDNASSDGSREMLAARYPHVIVVPNAENLGFGRAVNRGAVEARDAEVLILVKTTQQRFANLRERLVALHPYELPELIAVEIADGLPAYLDWIAAESAAGSGSLSN